MEASQRLWDIAIVEVLCSFHKHSECLRWSCATPTGFKTHDQKRLTLPEKELLILLVFWPLVGKEKICTFNSPCLFRTLCVSIITNNPHHCRVPEVTCPLSVNFQFFPLHSQPAPTFLPAPNSWTSLQRFPLFLCPAFSMSISCLRSHRFSQCVMKIANKKESGILSSEGWVLSKVTFPPGWHGPSWTINSLTLMTSQLPSSVNKLNECLHEPEGLQCNCVCRG